MGVLKNKDVMRKAKRIAWERLDTECVLLNLDNGSYFSFNEVGLQIWEKLDGESSVAEIALSIAKIYGLSYERVLPDVRFFLNSLLKRELVEVAAKKE